MAKPILVVKVTKNLRNEHVSNLECLLEARTNNEYHIIVTNVLSTVDAQFSCYNVDKIPEQEIEQLKIEIKEWINKN